VASRWRLSSAEIVVKPPELALPSGHLVTEIRMASPNVLDLDRLLAPIAGEKPMGIDLRTDATPGAAYYTIKDARTAARNAERQLLMDPEGPPADWRPVLSNGVKALAEKSKDLEITAYLIEALARLHGFAGLRDGFRLAGGLVERFWDGLYPSPDEEGVATRVAPLTGLNGDNAEGTLLNPIARVPITEATSVGRLACTNYQEALNFNKITDPKVREKRLAAGAMTLDKFQKALAETPPPFFRTLVEDLTQCQEEFAKLTAILGTKAGEHAPPTTSIRDALTSCLDVIKNVARDKLGSTAPKEAAPAKDGAPGATPTAGAAAPPGEVLDVIRDREDAFRALLKVADFFRRTEPHAVLSYSLEQIVRWGRLSLPELLAELIPDEAPRKNLFKQVGIKPPEPPPKK
jgi:type VI secretion system protein ImpA